ncbi:PepSY domain-containing protein [Sphingomonas sp. LT1P40]|uniref:PepSY domain-containing protein n=1 Tax=Alteristakelama amylovorans TaxID=3096166 RepID=UPI002FC793EE
MRAVAISLAATFALAACSPAPDAANTAENGVLAAGPETAISNVAQSDLPAGLAELVEATVPGMRIAEAERKERDGRVYYDVEGTRPDGTEVEIDVLAGADGKLTAVEVQRDIAWTTAPAPVVAAAAAKKDAFTPERVIESRQVEDGATIYELFAPGSPKEPAMEVKWQGGKAEVLGERWAH